MAEISRSISIGSVWVLLDAERGETRWRVWLTYQTCDPYSVLITLLIDDGDEDDDVELEWEVSRDVLAAGLGSHAGLYKVQVWPHDNSWIYVALLDVDDESWCYLAPRGQLAWLVRESLRLVPRGQESQYLGLEHLDDELAALVREERGT